MKKGRGVVASAPYIGREVLLPPADQRLGLLSPLGVLLLDFLEELHELLVAIALGVLDVLVVHLRAFCGVVEDAAEVEDRIAYTCELLCGSGHCSQSPLSSSCSLTTTSYTLCLPRRGGRLNIV